MQLLNHSPSKGLTVLAFLGVFLAASVPFRALAADTDTAADILRVAIPASAYGMTFLRHDPDGRGQFTKSFLTTVAFTYGLKSTIQHDGPNGHSRSFPSGHAATAFSGASFIQQRYGWQLGLPAVAAATFVGWSRIDSDDHDFADVLAGAAISLASTSWFTTKEAGSGLTVAPSVTDHSLGVTLFGHW